MNRRDLVSITALLDVSDDYESTDHIVQSVSEVSDQCRVVFDRQETIAALSDLIQSGLAKAYRLDPYGAAPEEIGGVPAPDEFDDSYTYFYITEKGKLKIRADRLAGETWPFDDYGSLRPGFCLERSNSS